MNIWMKSRPPLIPLSNWYSHDDDYEMKLQYQIINLLHPHYEGGRGCVYDHINWTVWIGDKELLNTVNESFDYDLELEKKNEVKEEVAYAIWHYIQDQKKWIGTFGTEYDRNILDIYND